MPQAAGGGLCSAIAKCDSALTSCLVDAVLIDDHNERIDAALKCMTEHTDCITQAIKDKDTARTSVWVETLKKHRRHR